MNVLLWYYFEKVMKSTTSLRAQGFIFYLI